MKQVISLFLCMFYTFISFGGTIYVHECSGGTSLGIYEKTTHANCPLCHKQTHNHAKSVEEKACTTDDCKDIEIQIDQISDQQLIQTSNFFHITSPAVLIKHWINLKPVVHEIVHHYSLMPDGFLNTNSSPPTFLLNRNFRI